MNGRHHHRSSQAWQIDTSIVAGTSASSDCDCVRPTKRIRKSASVDTRRSTRVDRDPKRREWSIRDSLRPVNSINDARVGRPGITSSQWPESDCGRLCLHSRRSPRGSVPSIHAARISVAGSAGTAGSWLRGILIRQPSRHQPNTSHTPTFRHQQRQPRSSDGFLHLPNHIIARQGISRKTIQPRDFRKSRTSRLPSGITLLV